MRKTSAKEMAAVLRLDGPARFKHFVKRAVDAEAAWGLRKGGWVLMGDDAETEVFPLWPAREYAEACKTGEWADHEAEAIDLDELLEDLLPDLASKGMLVGVFPTPEGRAVTPRPDELAAALRKELENYGE